MSGSVKKRNFTPQERSLLLEILKCFKNVIDNKKTDGVSAAIKKRAWADIAERYNTSAIISHQASGEQLRRLWINIKTRQKYALTRARQYRMSTGGGEPCPDADISPDVGEVVPSLLVETIDATDSDSIDPSTNLQYHQCEPGTGTTFIKIEGQQPSMCRIPDSLSGTPLDNFISPSQSNTLSPNHQTPTTHLPNTYSHNIHISDHNHYANNEKQLQLQILKTEHLNRGKRAEELHSLQVQHLKEQHILDKLIKEQNLKEASAKAELAQKNLSQHS